MTSDHGSAFILCELSRTDRRYPRYPRLPVVACTGFDARDPAGPPAGDPPPGRA